MDIRKHGADTLKEQNANSLLHSSIIKGNKSTFQEALKLGASFRSLSKFGDPPIVAAAGVDPYTTHDSKTGKDKMLEIFDLLLSHKDCDINGRGSGGETALHRAMTVRAQNRVKYLLEHQCDVDIRDSRGQTAIFSALAFPEGLELLLRYEPLLDVYDSDGLTPLMLAMMSESPQSFDTVKALVKAGCNVNAASASDGKSVLMVSLRGDDGIPRSDQRLDKTVFLLQHGTDINATDKQGLTILHYAIRSECVSLVENLIKHKANLDITDSTGSSMMSWAQNTSNPQIIRLVERALDKTSQYLPYEEMLQNLESLYSTVSADEAILQDHKNRIKSQIEQLQHSLEEVISNVRGSDSMTVEHKRLLAQNHSDICDEMMPQYVIPFLVKEQILSKEDAEKINSARARKLMCVKLLEVLPHRGSKAFPVLLSALRTSKQYRVCELLSGQGDFDVKL